MNTDIERLCRAACEAHDKYLNQFDDYPKSACCDYPYEKWSEHQKEEYRCVVRAILSELRKPSERMVAEGSNEICKQFPHCDCPGGVDGADDPQCWPAATSCWQAMLDSITEEDDER